MKFYIRHEAKGRMRIHVECNRMSCAEADVLATMLAEHASVKNAKVYERTADITVEYTGKRGDMLSFLPKHSAVTGKAGSRRTEEFPTGFECSLSGETDFSGIASFLIQDVSADGGTDSDHHDQVHPLSMGGYRLSCQRTFGSSSAGCSGDRCITFAW